MIKLCDISKQYQEIKEELLKEWDFVLQNGNLYLGKNTEEFEYEFANYIGSKYAVGVSSGTDGLILALKALGVKQKDRVIVPSFSFFATAEAICQVGAEPKFVDICPYTFTIQPSAAEEVIDKKTVGIITVHLYGHPANMDEILKIAKKYNLWVVEDCAQSCGSEVLVNKNYKKTGSLGDIGVFSFYPTKNLGCFGEGGCIVTNDEELAERVRKLRNHGREKKDIHVLIGENSRLDELQACVLRLKLKRLDSWLKKRRELASFYKEKLKNIEFVRPPCEESWARHSYNLFVIKAKRRDELFEFLKNKQIEVGIHYKIPIHKQPAFKKHNHINLVQTQKISKEVLSLPMHPHLEFEEIEKVVSAIEGFYYKGGVYPETYGRFRRGRAPPGHA